MAPAWGTRVLLVTAHPDDECMFFGPSIQDARARGADVLLLCLSRGGKGGSAPVRERELALSARRLGIARTRVLEHPALQDGDQSGWDPELVAAVVRLAVAAWAPSDLLTFDAGGVSGHRDHAACAAGALLWAASPGEAARRDGATAAAARQAWETGRDCGEWDLPITADAARPGRPRLWRLRTRAFKYVGAAPLWAADALRAARRLEAPSGPLGRLLGILLALSGSAISLVALFLLRMGRSRGCRPLVRVHGRDPEAVRNAMRAHASQLVWYRKAWLFLSSYLYFDDLELLE